MRDFQRPGRSTVHALNGMCATSHPEAARVAVDAMREGGNAVDAAVTAALTLTLLEPAMTGLGGDAFAMVWRAGEDRPRGLNGSGRAPRGADAAALRAEGHGTMPLQSPHAVTVPGAIDAFDRMLADWGTFGWERAVAPALAIARDGHPVAPRAAWDWAQNADKLDEAARAHFLIDGRPPRAGEVMRYPAQAEALERLAAEGRAGFYEGEVARDIVESLQALGGVHSMEDFAETRATPMEVISGTYRGVELIELPPNGQGATALLQTKVLEGFDLAALDPMGAERAHLEAEACRLAYDARNRLISDADVAGMGERLALMCAEETARAMREAIDPAAATPDLTALNDRLLALGPDLRPGGAPHRDTVYLTVVDAERTMVSLIFSVFNSFGGGLASRRFGIGLQNRGAGFTLAEGHPNEYGPGKRPLHTIIPAMLAKDGKPWASFGVMGGQYQANGHARVVSNLVDYGMDPQEALDAPRSFHQEGRLELETGYERGVLDRLGVMGHDAVMVDAPIGGGQIILIDPETGALTGGSDPRKDGCALGY